MFKAILSGWWFLLFCVPYVELDIVSCKCKAQVTCTVSKGSFPGFWPDEMKSLQTCFILNQNIESTGVTIAGASDPTVQGLVIRDKTNISFFPENIATTFPGLVIIIIRHYDVTSVNENNFVNLTELLILNLRNNKIESIASGSFKDLKKLQNLYLSGNNIQSINPTIFEGLENLVHLYLDQNSIFKLPEQSFESLRNLENISIASNKLTEIPKNLFEKNLNLKIVSIDDNEIKTISPDVFDHLVNLYHVDLRNNVCFTKAYGKNKFTEMKKDLTKKCESCEDLLIERDLEIIRIQQTFNIQQQNNSKLCEGLKEGYIQNMTKLVTTGDQLQNESDNLRSKLSELEKKCDKKASNVVTCEFVLDSFAEYRGAQSQILSTCFIKNQKMGINGVLIEGASSSSILGLSVAEMSDVKFIPENIAAMFPELVIIVIRDCSLQFVSEYHFEHLEELLFLDLSNNQIDSIAMGSFKDLTKLHTLWINGNNIQFISSKLFKGLESLAFLFMYDNEIESISEETFEPLTNLTQMSLQTNKLTKIPEHLFKNNLLIENIWLDANKIKCISSVTFDSLKNLKEVDLRDNICVSNLFDARKFEEMKQELETECKSCEEKLSFEESEIDHDHCMITITELEDREKLLQKMNKDLQDKLSGKYNETVVTCKISNQIFHPYWEGVNKILKTCEIKNQKIETIGVEVEGPPDPFVTGFLIQDELQVEYIPKNIAVQFPELRTFTIYKCSINFVSESHFSNLLQLLIVDLRHNEIGSIMKGAFQNQKKLQKLYLNGNKIQFVSSQLFNGLVNLQELHLNDNKIEFLPENVFVSLNQLINISIASNKLTEIPKNLFENNPKLQFIWLHGNEIRSISAGIADELEEIKQFDLQGNTCVSKVYLVNGFNNMKQELKEKCEPSDEKSSRIYIENTRIQQTLTGHKEKVKKLEKQLKESNITKDETLEWKEKELESCNELLNKFSDQTFEYQKALQDLRLANQHVKLLQNQAIQLQRQINNLKNRFTSSMMADEPKNVSGGQNCDCDVTCKIDQNSYSGFGSEEPKTLRTCLIDKQIISSAGGKIEGPQDTSVQILSIQDESQVEFIPENIADKLPELTVVWISNCSVRFVHEHHFTGLQQLEFLRLSHNKIESIASGSFTDLTNLQKLWIDGNKIQCINSKLFVGLHNLEHLEMQENEIVSLSDEILKPLSNLKTIFIHKNSLEEVSKDCFSHNPKLWMIRLGQNKIKFISTGTFDHLTNLRYLYLQNNICISKFYIKNDLMTINSDLKTDCEPVEETLARKDSEYDLVNLTLGQRDQSIVKLKFENAIKIRSSEEEVKQCYRHLELVKLQCNAIIDNPTPCECADTNIINNQLKNCHVEHIRTQKKLELEIQNHINCATELKEKKDVLKNIIDLMSKDKKNREKISAQQKY